ncbi:MAG: hypothetical protein II994_05795 [Lachnospiraceae bacterium]|nr:hypothetical protein [Lachnospiraceae bacterium]
MREKEKKYRVTDDFEEDWLEEAEESVTEENSPIQSFLTFVILIAVAGIVCVIIWVATHQDKETQAPVVPDVKVDQSVNETLAAPEVKQTEESTETAESEESPLMEFSLCNDIITPKEYVNLRTEPSTEGGSTTVYCTVSVGDKIKRTGYNLDYGWSRVEYEGQVLYVVTSYVEKVE